MQQLNLRGLFRVRPVRQQLNPWGLFRVRQRRLPARRLSPFGSISLCETALAGRCPRRGQRARYPIFASLKCGPALAPRRLSPFGSISLRETARTVTGPTFWVCRAKSGAAFRCAKPPCAVVRFAAMTSSPRTSILPSPSRLCRAGSPTAKNRRSSAYASVSPAAKPRVRSSAPPGPMCWPTPLSLRSSVAPRPTTRRLSPFGSISLRETARTVTGPTGAGILPSPSRLCRAGFPTAKTRPLLPFGRISPAAKPGWPVVAPAGGNVLATPFSLCSNVAPRSHPGARRLTPPFRLRRNRACGHRPHRGRCVGLPRFRFAQAWPLGQQPGACRRSAPFRCAKPRWPVVAPAGGNVLATPFSLRSNVAPRSHPGACRHSAPFRCAKPRVRLPAPPFGFAAQNQARHFAARNHPVRLSASRP